MLFNKYCGYSRFGFSFVILFYVLVTASSVSHAWDRWGVSYSNEDNEDDTIGNYIWTIDDSTGESTKVSTKLFDGNGWIISRSYVDTKTGELVIWGSGDNLHKYNIDTDTWTDVEKPDSTMQSTFARGVAVDDIAKKGDDGSVSIEADTNTAVKIASGIIADSSGNNIIKKTASGAIHIGENSLVTLEENGRQSVYATDGDGNKINIDVNNGSDLLVNGTSVMGSIRGLADGVKATTALNAAFSAVPVLSGDSEFECGMGLGRYSNKTAIASSCGARINDRVTASFGASILPTGTESYLLGRLPAVTFRAGISLKFGKSYASASSKKLSAVNDKFWNTHKLSELRHEMNAVNDRAEKAANRAMNYEKRSLKLENQVASLRQKLAQVEQLKKTVAHLASLVTSNKPLAINASLSH